jgi:predicted nucleic acid-binding protein
LILVLDTSGAAEFILNKPQKKNVESYLLNADLVIAPDIFICEITNVFWKYHHFESLPKKICEELIQKSLQLIDEFESSSILYREAYQFACEKKLSVYDALYIVLSRRNNGMLISMDKQLNDIARIERIKILTNVLD